MIEHFQNDKSTIFSIVPFAIREMKPGIYPGVINIDACLDPDKPERKVIGPSEHLKFIGGQKEPSRELCPSFQVAKAVVDDFINAQLWSDGIVHPGICWFQGDVSIQTFKTVHATDYNRIKDAQRKWFIRLVEKTGDDWRRYKNTRVVSDVARYAATFLGIETPEWMSTEVVAETWKACPACGTQNGPANVICSNCKCILDEAKFKQLKFAS